MAHFVLIMLLPRHPLQGALLHITGYVQVDGAVLVKSSVKVAGAAGCRSDGLKEHAVLVVAGFG